ncbi:glucosamine-6-phosphate deaminase [Streptomyces sp. WAC 05379]|uniref:glucosamine-6-phosphate deaminase n=1 Tax=Streptomyces sp. WAC 05379 TaxID=2203207 RepID=UPI000F73F636|nr:glucosamine-6-phosphate deaminase [Streptomyces sp. WAC 05379]RSO09984.1 glucosamine-6-phosphate deaminase [Streptomyces sp. WAC 05379]
MEVVVRSDAGEAGRTVADIVHRALRNGVRTLGLATGSSPLLAYRELIRRHRDEGLSFAGVDAFLLDEYVGLPATHPQTYAQVIRREFTEHIDLDPARLHAPTSTAPDPVAEAHRYEEALAACAPVNVQILGIGTNGHIGFNEPASSLASRTRLKTLTDSTRRDNARFFTTLEAVPRHGITQGLATISEAHHLVLIATGPHKAHAVAAAVEGPVSTRCPASILQLHPHATVVLDELAAAQLQDLPYYRHVARHKPAGQRY